MGKIHQSGTELIRTTVNRAIEFGASLKTFPLRPRQNILCRILFLKYGWNSLDLLFQSKKL